MSNYRLVSEAKEKIRSKELKPDIIKISLRINSKLFWKIKQLALSQRRSVTSLTDEAFTDILTKYPGESKN